jgi:hypothetical protein
MFSNLLIIFATFAMFGCSRAFKISRIHLPSLPRFRAQTTLVENDIKKLSKPEELLSKTDVFIFDCDGVIWYDINSLFSKHCFMMYFECIYRKGDSVIAGVPSVLDKLRALNKRIFFVTNNSTKSRKGYLKKFTSLGLNIAPEGNNTIYESSFPRVYLLYFDIFRNIFK